MIYVPGQPPRLINLYHIPQWWNIHPGSRISFRYLFEVCVCVWLPLELESRTFHLIIKSNITTHFSGSCCAGGLVCRFLWWQLRTSWPGLLAHVNVPHKFPQQDDPSVNCPSVGVSCSFLTIAQILAFKRCKINCIHDATGGKFPGKKILSGDFFFFPCCCWPTCLLWDQTQNRSYLHQINKDQKTETRFVDNDYSMEQDCTVTYQQGAVTWSHFFVMLKIMTDFTT